MNRSNIKRITVNGARVVNAQQLAQQFDNPPQWYAGINRVTCPSGPEPGYGKFLISCQEYEANWPENADFDIVFERTIKQGDDPPTTETLTLSGYVTLSAHAALRQPNSPMVVTIADARHLLQQTITNQTFNIAPQGGQTWQDILDAVKADLLVGFSNDLLFANAPDTFDPQNLRYEGWRTLDVIADIGYRTGHVLIYNPITRSLEFEPMSGTQAGIATIIDQASVHRQFEIPETEFADKIGTVKVHFDRVGFSAPAETIEVSSPNGGSREQSAWGSSFFVDQTDQQAEADALAATWFDWSARKTTRTVNEYFGALSLSCGSEISSLSWFVDNLDVFTLVDKDAPPKPTTKRQHVSPPVNIRFQSPAEGIPAGATTEVTVLSYQDGREIIPGENDRAMVKNTAPYTLYETGVHQGYAMPWGDHYEPINDFRECQ